MLFDHLPPEVSVYEVSPRDGLQNEGATVPLRGKLRLIDALGAAGLRRIEITSFVSPKWIPQLADADEVAAEVMARPQPEGVVYSALCPNARGLERARAAGIDEIAVFLSASETHNQKNINKTIHETMAAFQDTVKPAVAAGMRVRGYVSTVWGCPYEGVSLSDTIGSGTPLQTRRILELVKAEVPTDKLAMHMHDTRGTALANIVVGLEMGIRTFDASVGGLGGCPYAPGAAGNVATEDLVYMLHGMGIRTGIDLERLVEAGKAAASVVARQLPGKVHQAGVRSLRA